MTRIMPDAEADVHYKNANWPVRADFRHPDPRPEEVGAERPQRPETKRPIGKTGTAGKRPDTNPSEPREPVRWGTDTENPVLLEIEEGLRTGRWAPLNPPVRLDGRKRKKP